ncbi:MAG: T9SS type A sorting domain-containing protein [Bacteroidetes bacterium]|nr:MAG: T9SS type A sorting domain-containing protein [Bacteroidota bacterium]
MKSRIKAWSSLHKLITASLIYAVLAHTNAQAQTPQLVYDANQKKVNPLASEIQATAADHFYFSAKTQKHGNTIWFSDGTIGGTMANSAWEKASGNTLTAYPLNEGTLIRYRNTNNRFEMVYCRHSDGAYFTIGDSSIKDFISISRVVQRGDTAYFSGRLNGQINAHFYRFAEGDSIIQTFMDGSIMGYTNAVEVYPVNGKVCFQHYNQTYGNEWWVTDGTTNGTHLLKEIEPGTANNFINDPFILNDRLYFSATSTANGVELWETDGTSNGTSIKKETVAGAGNSYAGVHCINGDTALISLWNPDGSKSMYLLFSGSSLLPFFQYGSTGFALIESAYWNAGHALFIVQENQVNSCYISDGTALGTQAINLQLDPSYILSNIQLGDEHAFIRVYKSWQETGIVALPIHDINRQIWYKNSDGDSLVDKGEWNSRALVLGNNLYSMEYGQVDHNELAKYSIEANQIKRTVISSITAETESLNNLQHALTDEGLYFTHFSDSIQFYHSDGTPSSTTQIARIKNGKLIQFDSNEVFLLNYKDTTTLHRINGSNVDAQIAWSMGGPYNLDQPYKIGGTYYFIRQANFEADFYKYSNTTGLGQAFDFAPQASDNASIIGKWQDRLILSARDQNPGNQDLWLFNSVNGQAQKIVQMDAQYGEIQKTYHFTDSGFYYFTFVYQLNQYVTRIWFYNLHTLQNSLLSTSSICCSNPPSLNSTTHLIGSRLLWIRGDNVMIQTDATSGMTSEIRTANGDSLTAFNFIGSIGNQVLFIEHTPSYQKAYSMIDLNTLRKYNLQDSIPDLASVPKFAMFGLNTFINKNRLYFTGKSANPSVGQLWAYDSTTKLTKNLTNLEYFALQHGEPQIIGHKKETLYFSLVHPDYGHELWSFHLGCAGVGAEIEQACQSELFTGKALLETYERAFTQVYWKFSNGDSAIGNQFSYTLNDTNAFGITLIAEAGPNCRVEIPFSRKAQVRSTPSYQVSEDSLCFLNNEFQITANDPNPNKAFSWTWESSSNSSSSVWRHHFTGMGQKTVKVKSSINGACPDSASFLLTVLPSPSKPSVFGPQTSQQHATDTFYIAGEPATSYNWQSQYGQMLNNQGDTFAVFKWTGGLGYADVQVSALNQVGCGSDTSIFTLSLEPNSTDYVNSEKLLVYPNPFEKDLSLSGISESATLRITSANGQVLLLIEAKPENGIINLQTSQLTPGTYILSVIQNNHILHFPLIKQ